MRVFRSTKFYKLIISSFAMALCFIAFSVVAWADPLTGAMVGSGIISGFQFTVPPGPNSGVYKMPSGYTDPYDWNDPVNWDTGKFTVRLDHSSQTGKTDVTLSSAITANAFARLQALQTEYGLQPGQVHVVGTYLAIGDYVFFNQSSGFSWGGDLGVFGPDSAFIVANNVNLISSSVTANQFPSTYTIGNNTGTFNAYANSQYVGQHVVLYMANNRNLSFGVRESFHSFTQYVNPNLPFDSETISLSRDNDSVMTDPDGNKNKITVPDSYLQDIPYTPGEDIDIKTIVEEILRRLFTAYTFGEIDDSVYIPEPGPEPTPSPAPGETIANTQYSELEGDLGDISDAIGTGNSLLDDIKDLLGNVTDGIKGTVEDIADFLGTSNSLLDDIKDLLGNVTDGIKGTVEDISDAITNTVDGIKVGVNSIISILQGIAAHVAELVEEIVNAEFNWVNGFITNFFGGFSDWFSTLRQHVSIWHYVVEWLSDISTCFAFFWGALEASGNRFTLPIFASFAGTVVIAIYRRFGR